MGCNQHARGGRQELGDGRPGRTYADLKFMLDQKLAQILGIAAIGSQDQNVVQRGAVFGGLGQVSGRGL